MSSSASVCAPDSLLASIFGMKLAGLHPLVKVGTEMVSPNRYNWSPQHPIAFIIEALCTTETRTPASYTCIVSKYKLTNQLVSY